MGKRPNLDELEYLFENRADVRLTDKLYKEKTGVSLPKEKSYLKNKSAFSQWLKAKGYEIVDIQEKPIVEKTIIIKKK